MTPDIQKLLDELEIGEAPTCGGCRGEPRGLVECCNGADGCPCHGQPYIPWVCPSCNGTGHETPIVSAIRQYIRQLEAERETMRIQLLALAKWALEAREPLELLVRLHLSEQEGIATGIPTPAQWIAAVDTAGEVLYSFPQLP